MRVSGGGPREQYLRRVWAAEVETNVSDPFDNWDFQRNHHHYATTYAVTYADWRPAGLRKQPTLAIPTPGPSSPLEVPAITFWNSHRSRIPGTTTHGFRRGSEFSTPIELALDPPSWPGWKSS
ncbi:hypothetical protein SK128_003595 [Halocaridina rubra]|uniref:Uncharacterized protein n=1 Tax=Halocaridina rubra TaxID=373956 RepID=A0AAN9AAW2_HALRR